jgi:hypothetical protein
MPNARIEAMAMMKGSNPHLLVAIPPPALVALQRALGSYVGLAPVHTFERAIARLRQNGNIAIVVCGVFFDGYRMFELLHAVKKTRPALPFICCRILARELPETLESLKMAVESLGSSFIDFPVLEQQYGAEVADSELRALVLAELGKESKT